MDYNTIEFWDLQSTSGRTLNSHDKGVIYGHNKKWPTWTLRLPSRISEAWDKGFKYLQVASNTLTGEIFFRLTQSNGLEIKQQSCNKGALAISCKVLIQRLESELDLPKEGGGVLDFSENLDRSNGYTYKITKSKKP